jgi:hypothetical protein
MKDIDGRARRKEITRKTTIKGMDNIKMYLREIG